MANTGIITWSTTEASNATADSSINWQEGQSPASVNNSARAMMARFAEYFADIAGTKITSTNTATNAYVVDANQSWDTITDGMRVAFIADHTNTGAATINVNGTGVKALRALSATALQAGAVVANQIYEAAYDSGNDEWLLVNTPPSWASQAQMEAAASNSVIVPPGRLHYHPAVTKAWARFNAAAVITTDYGVSTVTDVGAGEWTVNFDTAFSAATAISAHVSVANNSGTLRFISILDGTHQTTSTKFVVCGTGGGQSDPDGPIYVSFFGDQ